MIHPTIAIIQARMNSSRLPGKVLADVCGKPSLQQMHERLQKSKTLDGVALATTVDPSDDILAEFCRQRNIPCYRGSLQDVLDRYYQAASQFHAEVIVRLTGDCPLIDPEVLDLTVATFFGDPLPQDSTGPPKLPDHYSLSAYNSHFAANRLPPPWKRSLPIGLDVEVCSFEALERAWQEAREPHQREHVLPYLYEGVSFEQPGTVPGKGWYVEQGSTPRGFRVALLNHVPDYGSLRWTVDTPTDLEFVRQVTLRLGNKSSFGWQDILALLGKEPELSLINAGVAHKSAFDVDGRQKSD